MLIKNNKILAVDLIKYLEEEIPTLETLENIFFYGSMFPNEKSFIDSAKILFEYIDPSQNNQYLLRYCAMRGYEDGMKILIEDKRTNITDLKDDLLFYARKFGNNNIVKLIE